MLHIVVLFGSQRSEASVVLINGVLTKLLILTEHCKSALTVRVSIEIEIKRFKGKIVFFVIVGIILASVGICFGLKYKKEIIFD